MIIPKYCGANDPLLSYTTRLHPLEVHTTTRQPINAIPYNDKSDDSEIKTEIKTENGDVKTINLGEYIQIIFKIGRMNKNLRE